MSKSDVNRPLLLSLLHKRPAATLNALVALNGHDPEAARYSLALALRYGHGLRTFDPHYKEALAVRRAASPLLAVVCRTEDELKAVLGHAFGPEARLSRLVRHAVRDWYAARAAQAVAA